MARRAVLAIFILMLLVIVFGLPALLLALLAAVGLFTFVKGIRIRDKKETKS